MKLTNFVILFISIIIILLCGEMIIRIFYPRSYTSSFFQPQKWMFNRDDEWVKKAVRPAENIGFELIPGIYGINNLGLFDEDRKIEKDKDVFKILVLGDSVTTHGHPPYSKVLEVLLNQSSHRYHFEVWNAAFPTYNTLLEKEYFRIKGIKFNPDMVIIGFCLNDFGPSCIALKKDGKMVLYNITDDLWLKANPFLISHSHLYRLIMGTIIAKIKIYYRDNKKLRSEGNRLWYHTTQTILYGL